MKTQIELLKEFKIPIRGRIGQHLLVDPNIQRKIVDLLALKSGECVLEIGPGLGALTGIVLERGGSVIAVEMDSRLCGVLNEIFPEEIKSGRLTIRNADILETDIPGLIAASGKPVRQVISNLPYYITGPILAEVLPLRIFDRAVFMMQQEVAQRIFAAPGTREYGRLSLLVSFFSKARYAFDVSPGCFTPPPEVNSTVVAFDFHESLNAERVNEALLLDLVKAAFNQRRKKLISSLSRANLWKLSRTVWQEIFEATGLSADARPETLNSAQYMMLAKELDQRLNGQAP